MQAYFISRKSYELVKIHSFIKKERTQISLQLADLHTQRTVQLDDFQYVKSVKNMSLQNIWTKALAIVLRTIAIAIAIEVKKSIEYCNMQ